MQKRHKVRYGFTVKVTVKESRLNEFCFFFFYIGAQDRAQRIEEG